MDMDTIDLGWEEFASRQKGNRAFMRMKPMKMKI
jgi:hypothetical protein